MSVSKINRFKKDSDRRGNGEEIKSCRCVKKLNGGAVRRPQAGRLWFNELSIVTMSSVAAAF